MCHYSYTFCTKSSCWQEYDKCFAITWYKHRLLDHRSRHTPNLEPPAFDKMIFHTFSCYMRFNENMFFFSECPIARPKAKIGVANSLYSYDVTGNKLPIGDNLELCQPNASVTISKRSKYHVSAGSLNSFQLTQLTFEIKMAVQVQVSIYFLSSSSQVFTVCNILSLLI